MKKTILAIVLAMLLVPGAFACHEMVHVEDDQANDMPGVWVKLASDCGWGPANDDTAADGWTTNWSVYGSCLYTASVPNPPDGYTCDTGTDYNTGDQGYIYLVCTPTGEVPEFGTMGAALALLGAAGYVTWRRRA
ncbi:hypothetical protein JXB02_01145 [Candidatus Woesearchaeota archaeon]|nr:hypothetical protein [Candidatus Woesearchaeota archaeon]